MKACVLSVIITLLWLSGSAQKRGVDTAQVYTVKQLQHDFLVLRHKLEKSHPNLYLYTPKNRFDVVFDSLYNTLNKPMPLMGFYNCITALYPYIANGHTLFLPNPKLADYENTHGLYIPVDVCVVEGKLFVKRNCSSNTALQPGTEVTAINGVPAAQIITTLVAHQVRDGFNTTFPQWIVNKWFRVYYSFTYGHPTQFTIEYTPKSGVTANFTCNALHRDSITFYRAKNAPEAIKPNAKPGITLQYLTDLKAKALTIPSFDDKTLRKQYKQRFCKEVKQAFKKILADSTQNLIIDLRNNQGGNTYNAKVLLAQLLTKPFTMIQKGPSAGKKKHAKHVYSGKVYCIVNGGSFSASGMVASVLESENRATFVGQEAGGNKTILMGMAHTLTLPNTKIKCQISARTFKVRNEPTTGHGVIPTVNVPIKVADVISGFDREMDVIIGLIKKGE